MLLILRASCYGGTNLPSYTNTCLVKDLGGGGVRERGGYDSMSDEEEGRGGC